MSKSLEELQGLYSIIEKPNLLTGRAYTIIEKELKTLEIIKERRCNVADFIIDDPNWDEVMKDYEYWFSEMPTQEEYNLLKEVLLWAISSY